MSTTRFQFPTMPRIAAAATFATALALTACATDREPKAVQEKPSRANNELVDPFATGPVPVSQPAIEAPEPIVTTEPSTPQNATTHYLQGIALWKSGRDDEARTSLERAAALAPRSVRTWVNLARVRMSQGDASAALDAADSALAIDAASADALHQRGRALAALQRTEDALATLTRAHETAPANGYIANTLGWVLLVAGRAEAAVRPLESAREQLPEVAYVRNNLGVAYERTGELGCALAEYRAAIAGGDSNGKAAASLARLSPLLPHGSDSAVACGTGGATPDVASVQAAATQPDGTH